MQGISPNQASFTKIPLENICEFNNLRANSLCGRAGNYFARAGNNSTYSTGTGNLARGRFSNPTHPIASRISPYQSPADVAVGRPVGAQASIDPIGTSPLERSAVYFGPWSRPATRGRPSRFGQSRPGRRVNFSAANPVSSIGAAAASPSFSFLITECFRMISIIIGGQQQPHEILSAYQRMNPRPDHLH
jgi:hypothetical protein